MCTGKNTDYDSFIFADPCLTNNKEEKILRVTIDSKLNF